MIGAFKGAYKSNPDVAPGSLEALAMQESSMGTNKSQYNPNNGKYGYLFGLTPGAFTDTGFKPSDANTMEGAANVAAKYYSMRSKLHGATGDVIKTYTTPSDIYNRYTVTSAHPKTAFDEDKYNTMVDYYKNLQTNPAPMADNAQ